jgi:hypothetical protein
MFATQSVRGEPSYTDPYNTEAKGSGGAIPSVPFSDVTYPPMVFIEQGF